MTNPDLSLSPEKTTIEARRKIEQCRTELRDLLNSAQHGYRATLDELDQIVTTSVERRGESLASRVEHLQRSKMLQRSAEEFDTAINYLRDATNYLGEASDALHGKLTLRGPSKDQ